MADPAHDLELIHQANGRLVRTVDGLSDEDWSRPSGLPDWTRAQVIAHLTLNAEALTAVLNGLHTDEPVPMYSSGAARDTDIDDLAADGPSAMRDRFLGSGTEFHEAVSRTTPEAWAATALRTPTGPPFLVAAIPDMRLREIEIHHADLDAGYGRHDWPAEFVVRLLDAVTVDHAGSGPFRVEATDMNTAWLVGGRVSDAGIATVSGRGADLGWWLTGRGRGDGLHVDADDLPRIGPWRRTPGK